MGMYYGPRSTLRRRHELGPHRAREEDRMSASPFMHREDDRRSRSFERIDERQHAQ